MTHRIKASINGYLAVHVIETDNPDRPLTVEQALCGLNPGRPGWAAPVSPDTLTTCQFCAEFPAPIVSPYV